MSTEVYDSKYTHLVGYVSALVSAVLLLHLVLKLLGANSGTWFTDTLYGVSTLLLFPFQGAFGTTFMGSGVIEWSAVLALVVYWLLFDSLTILFSKDTVVLPVDTELSLSRAHKEGY